MVVSFKSHVSVGIIILQHLGVRNKLFCSGICFKLFVEKADSFNLNMLTTCRCKFQQQKVGTICVLPSWCLFLLESSLIDLIKILGY